MATAGDRYEERTGNIWSYSHRGDMTGLKAAVVRGVDVNMVNTVGWTACHAAAAGGQTKALRYLVKKMDADLTITDKGGNLAVHHAAKNGHVHALRTLQELGADVTKVRLSQAKGKATRELLTESYRKAGKCEMEDSYDEIVQAVGYARKQSKSTAFWGPRRTPISCAIKKKIIKDKRKIRKQKHKSKRDRETTELEQEEDITNGDEEAKDEPSYIETVQQIKRSRKQKRRQRQKSKIQEKSQQQRGEENCIDPIHINRKKINDIKLNANDRDKLTIRQSFSDTNDDRGENDIGDNDSDADDYQRFHLVSNGQFAALALTEDDSDRE